ncbi:ATP-binding cassette domain-containing protein [bacterium]|nr:ATP-binding cassette domain-containing protein [bacterium]
MITLERVSKSYRSHTILAPLDWKLDQGKTYVLIGPSGCGKSTLLRLMIGLVAPSEGRILFNGNEVHPKEWRNIRLRMGYVIQDGGLFPHLTAKSNILLMAHELGWNRNKRESRLAELVELTHFPADGLSRYPAQLSGGQKQRVGIMRGLLLDPDVILLDEPLGALDPIIRHNLQTELRGIFQTLGKTVVLVTHDVAEARYFGDEILLMRRGRIVQRGSFDDLVSHPAEEFVSNFIQSPRGLEDSEEEIEAMNG